MYNIEQGNVDPPKKHNKLTSFFIKMAYWFASFGLNKSQKPTSIVWIYPRNKENVDPSMKFNKIIFLLIEMSYWCACLGRMKRESISFTVGFVGVFWILFFTFRLFNDLIWMCGFIETPFSTPLDFLPKDRWSGIFYLSIIMTPPLYALTLIMYKRAGTNNRGLTRYFDEMTPKRRAKSKRILLIYVLCLLVVIGLIAENRP